MNMFEKGILVMDHNLANKARVPYIIKSVSAALDFLEAICEEGRQLRIGSLSKKLDMNKSAVFRMLATFENKGYVERVDDDGGYRLAQPAFDLGQRLVLNMDLFTMAKPIMEMLARKCDEAIYLVIPRKTEVVFFSYIDTSQKVRVNSLVGKAYPLEQTAAGRVIEASRRRDSLSPDLVSVCIEGVCTDQDALGEGIVSHAVPLFKSGGVVCGALCMVGPVFRMAQSKKSEEYLTLLKDAGCTLSLKLGHVYAHGAET